MKRKISLILVVSMILLTLVACSGEPVEEENFGQDVSEDIEEDANKDLDDEDQVIDENEDFRVVTTYLPATDLVLSLQGKDNLVAVDDKSIKSELLEKLNPNHEIKAIGSRKNGVNIEEIVGLEPDLVVLYPARDGDDTEEKLKNEGINAIRINPETLESLKEDILTIGKAMNKEDLAVELNDYMEEKVEMVKTRVSDIEDKKSVYLAGSRGMFSTHSGDFYQHEIIDLAGGKDLSEDLVGGWNELSAEQVIAWDPDLIVTVNYSSDDRKSILENPALASVKAIENDEVYTIPSNIESWDLPKPSSVLAIMWMGKTLYPDKFEDVDIKEEADALYKDYYGKSFTELGGNLGEK